MIVELIISVMVLLATFWLIATPNTNPFSIEIPPEKEELNFPQRLRRIQQALLRKENDLFSWEGELGHQSQKLSIGVDLLQLGEKDLAVNNNILKQRENELELSFREKNLDLKEREIDVKFNYNLLEISKQEFSLDKKEQENLNEQETRLLDLREISLNQEEKRLDLKDKEGEIAENKRMLSIFEQYLKLQDEKLNIKDYDNEVKHRDRMVKLGEKELKIGFKELEHAYNVKSFQLETILQNIRHQFKDLELEKKSFSLFKERQNLDLYKQRLQDLQTHINNMYVVKMEWLKLEAKENNLENREEQLRLRTLFDDTQRKISDLAITRREINHHWDKRALEHKTQVLKFIGKNW